jgi:hypothetical protein
MKAARVLGFSRPNVIINDDLPRPVPAARQLLVRIKRSGDRASSSKAPHFRHPKPSLGGDVSDYLVFFLPPRDGSPRSGSPESRLYQASFC